MESINNQIIIKMQTNYITNSTYGPPLALINGNIDLLSESAYLDESGIYEVLHGTNPEDVHYLYIREAQNLDGQRIVVSNKDYTNFFDAQFGGGSINSPLIGGTGSATLNSIAPGKTYTFISNGNRWIVLPSKGEYTNGAISGTVTLTEPGIYSSKIGGTGTVYVTLPEPSELDGQRITMINSMPNPSLNPILFPNNDIYSPGGALYINGFVIGVTGSAELVSVGGEWRLVYLNKYE